MADTLPAEAIEAAAAALYTADYRNGEPLPFAKYPVGSYWGDRYRSEAHAALLAALPHLARRAAVPSEQEPVAWRWRWKDQLETDGWCLSEVDPRPGSTPTRMERFDEVQPLYAHPAPAAGVKVKPLEWEPDHVGGGLRAGEYHLRPGLWTRGYYWLRGDDEPHTGYPDEDEAKAAAQADYEARIRSALG